MTDPTETPAIADNAQAHRYELALGGRIVAHIDYRMRREGTIDLIHTEVAPDQEGRGLASRIAKFALDDARSRGLKVVASCSYVAGYVRKHPEYGDLLAQR